MAIIRTLLKTQSPLIMGVINVTPDSFYDGGATLDPGRAVFQAERMVSEGAHIIDIGGESSRPGSAYLSAKDELARVLPVIREIRKSLAVPLSLDTRKSEVAQAGLDNGVKIINDISALQDDPKLLPLIARHGADVVLMHMQGVPASMQNDPQYNNLLREIHDFLHARIQHCLEGGIHRDAISVDPGIGFGKTLAHNLTLLKRIPEWRPGDQPVLIGASRKSFIGKIHSSEPQQRLPGTLAAHLYAALQGADILRVHDVGATRQALSVWRALEKI